MAQCGRRGEAALTGINVPAVFRSQTAEVEHLDVAVAGGIRKSLVPAREAARTSTFLRGKCARCGLQR
jgi:hypothetical protein